MERRGFLGLVAGAVGALTVPKAALATAQAPTEIALPTELAKHANESERWYAELEMYAYLYHNKYPTSRGGMSIPFATLPCNMYVRNPAIEPAPELTSLRQYVETQDKPELPLRWLLRRYMLPRLRQQHPHGSNVNGMKRPRQSAIVAAQMLGKVVMMPSRIVSPKYVIDIAELTNSELATMLICAGDGILDELQDRANTAKSAAPADSKCVLEYTLPDLFVKREGFMFELYAWIEARGVYAPAGSKIAYNV